MKKYFLYICLILSALAFYHDAHAEETSPQEKIIIVGDSWCPYNCDPGSEKPGFLIEIAQAAFANHNIDVEYRIVPWEKALEGVSEGQYHAAVGASYGDAPDFIFPENEQAVGVMAFYGLLENTWKYKNVRSLDSISLGVVAGYSYGEPLDSYIAEHGAEIRHIQTVAGDNALDLNIVKLTKGKIDAFIENQKVASYKLSMNENKDKIHKMGSLPISESNKIFIAFSPKHQNAKIWADILSKETAAMEKNGRMEIILRKYGIQE